MLTECPECDTTFRVTTADLRRAGGKVRCGECDVVFNALESLTDVEPEHLDDELDINDQTASAKKLTDRADPDPASEAADESESEPQSETDWLETGSLEFDIPPQKWLKFFGDNALLRRPAKQTDTIENSDASADPDTSAEAGDEHSAIAAVDDTDVLQDTDAEAIENTEQEDLSPNPDAVPSATDTATQEESEWMRALYEAVSDDDKPMFLVEETDAVDTPTDSPDATTADADAASEDKLEQTDSRAEPALGADWNIESKSETDAEPPDTIDADDDSMADTHVFEENDDRDAGITVYDGSDTESETDTNQETSAPAESDHVEEHETSENETASEHGHDVGSEKDNEAYELDAADADTDTSTPPWAGRADAVTDSDNDAESRLGWSVAAAALALLLLGQLLHYQRDSLATHHKYGDVTRELYGALNAPLYPNWDIDSYEIRGSEAVAGEKGSEILEIRAQIAVVGDHSVGPPLLQVLLRDRWANVIAGGVFSPAEYFADPADYDALLRPGSYVPLRISVDDPGAAAQGYELQLCLQQRNRELQCSKSKRR
ncbi:MAG: DUF3426 domain-containing protein [Gammaproteobacteria bacterium]